MKRFYLPLLLIIIQIYGLIGQSWTITSPGQVENKGKRDIIPEEYTLFRVDDDLLKSLLWDSPKESSVNVRFSDILINVALSDEKNEKFRVVEYDMMEPGLASRYPEIRTFYGISVTDELKRIRIDYTLQGFRAVISKPGESKLYIDYYQRDDKYTRIIYKKQDLVNSGNWECDYDPDDHDQKPHEENSDLRVGDCQLRSYRLAQATTGEYSNYFGATSSAQSGLVMSQVVTAINRVNEIYEAELAVRLILIANTDQVFYYNSVTDGYTNDGTSNDLTANQTNCTNVIGSANYDIGHVFGTGDGGIAGLNVVCNSASKAKGYTGRPDPVGDPFVIDYVTHEMGHQFGGNHTQYNSCNRNDNTAMEPGSASTIMGYAGICPPNVQNNSDPYFHAISLQEIKTFLTGSGNACAQIVGTFTNTAPNVVSQPNYTIPKSTPFVLTLTANDPNGDPITYLWDEMDAYSTPAQTMPPLSANTTGPMFRSIIATSSPSRFFPPLDNILNNTVNTWQVLPSVSRTMNFRGIARDFTGVAGCNSEINLTVTTVAAAGPFNITSQNSATTWLEGETKTITWDVAGTTGNGINTANVIILMSYDGGSTFPVTLISSTANDGSEDITVPEGLTSSARIMVKSIGNVFFDINDINIVIEEGVPTFDLSLSTTNIELCPGFNDNLTVFVNSILGFSDPVFISVSGVPSGVSYSFSQNPVIPGQNSVLTLMNNNAAAGLYNVQVTGVSGSIVKSKTFNLQISVLPSAITLVSPSNNSTNISIKPLLTWTSATGATGYELIVSRDPDFGSFILNTVSSTNNFQIVNALEGLSFFYWRVKSNNLCGSSEWSPVFTFSTESCFAYTSTDIPIVIPSNGTSTVYSYLPVSDRGVVTDLDVWNLTGLHSYVDDLKFTLFAPSSVNVLFWNRPCTSQDNFNINFDQSAPNGNWPCPPTDGGFYLPSNSLVTFNNQQIKGQWSLRIQDVANGDGGSLQSWKIKTCVNNFCRLRVDNTYSKGAGSLFAAISCASTGDTIRFINSIQNDTINLGEENLVIDKHIVIEGDITKNIHIFGNGIQATFQNSAPTSSNGLIIKGVHIHSGGSNSFAIENNGKLILDNSIIHNYPGFTNTAIINNEGSSLEIKGNCQIKDQ
ncbi:MAG: reprolysin-like metallopeptidase [Deltaproteobacteria bacterium]